MSVGKFLSQANKEEGFTLLEIMVAVAVVTVLSAAVAPNVLSQIERSKRARALADAKVVAAAVNAFYNDVGELPYRYTSESDMGRDASALTDEQATTRSGYTNGGYPRCWRGAAGGCWNYYIPFRGWLTANSWNYSNWRGPYLSKDRSDPWGRKYYVLTIGNGPARHWGCNNTWSRNSVVVLSAGPNGVIESPTHMWYRGGASNWEMHTYGDDIFYVAQNLKNREMCPTDDF